VHKQTNKILIVRVPVIIYCTKIFFLHYIACYKTLCNQHMRHAQQYETRTGSSEVLCKRKRVIFHYIEHVNLVFPVNHKGWVFALNVGHCYEIFDTHTVRVSRSEM